MTAPTARFRWPPVSGRALLIGALAGAALAGDLAGQTPDTIRAWYRLPQVPTFAVSGHAGISPGTGIGVPGAFGVAWGVAIAGLSYQARTRLYDHSDGTAVLVLGAGDPVHWLGLEVGASSYGTLRSCCRGALSFKVHRALPFASAVAVGRENAVVWGKLSPNSDISSDAGTSYYGVVSKVTRLDGRDPIRTLTLSLGVGNGRFRSESDILAGRERVNVFGGAALRVLESAALVGDWTGQDLVLGASVLPIPGVPFVLVPALADVTTKPRFVLGAGIGFDYGRFFRSQRGTP